MGAWLEAISTLCAKARGNLIMQNSRNTGTEKDPCFKYEMIEYVCWKS